MQSYIKRENAYFSGNKRVFASSPFVRREGRVKGLRDAGVECEWLRWVENFICWCPHFFIPWGAATKTSWWISCSEHKDAKEETQRDKWGKKKQSGDLFSKSDQIYFVSFVYLVSLSSLGFYKTQMLSSLNRLTSWKSDRAQIKILIIMIIIIIRDPTYLKNIL